MNSNDMAVSFFWYLKFLIINLWLKNKLFINCSIVCSLFITAYYFMHASICAWLLEPGLLFVPEFKITDMHLYTLKSGFPQHVLFYTGTLIRKWGYKRYMAAPNSNQRQACWDARNRFWNCLDENGDNVVTCKKFQDEFETKCPRQWVWFFDKPVICSLLLSHRYCIWLSDFKMWIKFKKSF